MVVHIGLALLMRRFPFVATIHVWITFAVGMWIAFNSRDYRKVIPVAAYITGAEVLWRMTNAGVFWEFGKYATVAILGIALLRRPRVKQTGAPIIYFIFLLPSVLITFNELGLTEEASSNIRFNLSGPLALSVCVLYFSQIQMRTEDMKSWAWSAVYPITGISALAAYTTLTATEIAFGSESIFVTSGGYGPNQVSAILGLGALILIMLAIQGRHLRLLALGLAALLLTQSVLTFSRGGIVNVVIGLALAFIHLLGRPQKYRSWIISILIFVTIAGLVIYPRLNVYTTGMLEQRYSDFGTAGREEIALAEFQLWIEQPLLGVGPGMAGYHLVDVLGRRTTTHTEYTRILAEHGLIGALALMTLLLMAWRAYRRAPDQNTRAWTAALIGWSLVEMSHSAMRIVSISFIFGLAMVSWERAQIMREVDSKVEINNIGPVKLYENKT